MAREQTNELLKNDLLFPDEVQPPAEKEEPKLPPWKLLIVDDEIEIHKITKLVLGNFTFQNRNLHMLSAYSAKEAKSIFKEHPDIAVILLDVVMEHDESGLAFVRYIRENIKNEMVRIILRTGQPGQAPEKEVVENYDINDYKEKTELTSQKLVTSIIASLRSYTGILTIAQLNDELEERIKERTRQLEQSIDTIRKDEEAGKKIQFKLLPPEKQTIDKYNFSRHLIPSLYLSGDFLDYFEISDRYIGFYMADVAGHGASSAFITVLLKSFISNCLDRYKTGHARLILSPTEILKKMNNLLIEDKLDKHLTLFYGLIDRKEQVLRYANGGQFPFPILFDGNTSRYIECKSIPVGLFDFADYTEERIELPESFILLLVSDGVLEILHQPRLKQQLQYLLDMVQSLDINIDSIMKRMAINKMGNFPDDLTFLMIHSNKSNYT
jgi:serine phosphatase RsbU (regulator of sigma subunit)